MQTTQSIAQPAASRWQVHMRAVAEQRDNQAFRALYLHFAPKIKSFYINQGIAQHAEELTHEVFLKIWQKAASYNPEKANVSTWLFTIVRNQRIEFLRRKRPDTASVDEMLETGQELTPDADTETNEAPDAELEAVRERKQLSSVLSQLTAEQRNVIQKVYFEDKSHQHAANELGMTVGVVKSRIRSALQTLRAHINGDQRGGQQ